jgi:AraC-like DNA-binding protein
MFLIQSLLSFTIIVLTVLAAISVFRDARVSLQSRLLAMLSLSVGAGFFWMLPEAFAMPEWLRGAFRLLSIPSTGLMWCFTRSLLDDDYRFSLRELAVVVMVSVFPALYCLQAFSVDMPWLAAVSAYGSIPPFAAMAYLVWSILRGFRDDLVEPRRRFRFWVVGVIIASSALSILSEELQNQQAAQLLRSVAILPSVALLTFWLLRFQANNLLFLDDVQSVAASSSSDQFSGTETEALMATEQSAESHPVLKIDPKDQSTFGRLQQLMANEKVFLQADLNIYALALQLHVPEHQLRALINGGLGYRNFSHYLAEARIQHAKMLLADPGQARRQILAIAMDSGFASLATFNRAFKSTVGTTPTDFRNEQLQNQMQERSNA